MIDPSGKIPVRIELATSEIESGPCRAWADPVQVTAAVAISEPSDSYTHYVKPGLEELSVLAPEGTGDGPPLPGGELPLLVRELIDRLQKAHARLYRDNRAGLEGTSRQVRITCAVGDEDRVYFVKASSTWVGLLRDGVAHPVEDLSETSAAHSGLGGSEKLRLEVTSLPVLPGDVVVMLAAEEDAAPELRAVASVFAQTHDLKRACDGLVNLLGLQSEGAAAVAFRFVPIASSISPDEENPIASLQDEFDQGGVASATGTPTPPVEADSEAPSNSGAESFLDSLGVSNIVAGGFGGDVGSEAQEASSPSPPSSTTPSSNASTASPPSSSAPSSSAPSSSAPSSSVTDSVEAPQDGTPVASESAAPPAPTESANANPATPARPVGTRLDREHYRSRSMLWPALVAVVIGLGVGLAAVPGGGLKKLFPSETLVTGPTGELVVEPNPPAKSVLVDGKVVAQGTPAHFPNLSAGTHTVGFDLGAFGMWESEVKVPEGETLRFAPEITGSVQVTVADPSRAGKVWVEGSEQQALPALIEGLPVGWNRIFYEDEKLPIWDQQVLVRSDGVATLVVPNNLRKGEGLFRIESLSYREGRGLLASPRDSVFIDDRWAGLTPLESRVEPGLHSVRIRSKSGEVHTEMLEVHSAGTRYVVAQFGMSARPTLSHRAPGRVELQGSLVLTMEVSGKNSQSISRPTLHFPDVDAASREIQLSQIDPDKSVYVGIFDPKRLPLSRDVRYYFTVEGESGETVYSDLYTLVVGRKGKAARSSRVKKPSATTTRPPSLVVAPPSTVVSKELPASPETASNPAKTASGSGSPVTETKVPTEVELPLTVESTSVVRKAPAETSVSNTVTTPSDPPALPPENSPENPPENPEEILTGAEGELPLDPEAPTAEEEPGSFLELGLEAPSPPKREVTIRQ